MRKACLDSLRWDTVLPVCAYHVCYLYNGVGVPGSIPLLATDRLPPSSDGPFCGLFTTLRLHELLRRVPAVRCLVSRPKRAERMEDGQPHHKG